MKTVPEQLAQIIVEVARQEDLVLRRVGKGVLLMPELAFAYAVGRRVALEASSIFGKTNVTWQREQSVSGLSGRTDLVFDVDGDRGLAVEFKMDAGWESYRRDIEKLSAIDSTRFHRIFCGLLLAWPRTLFEDPRVKKIKDHFQSKIEPLHTCSGEFDFFTTLSEDYKDQVCCIVAMWRLADSFTSS